MNERQSVQGLSRRGFLGGAAGIVVAAALPSSRAAGAAVTPLAGATVSAGSYGVTNALDAAHIADGYIGLPLATTIQKVYTLRPDYLETKPPARMTELAAVGCQFLVAVRPSRRLYKSEQTKLGNWLAMLTNAGMTYRIVIFSEANNAAFKTVDEWLAYWRFYAPVVQAAGVPCCYDAGCHTVDLYRAIEYLPSGPVPDEVWMDYYASGFRTSVRLEPLITAAQAAGVSAFGLGEWGWEAGHPINNPMTIPWWNAYGNYLIELAGQGTFNLGAIYYGSLGDARLVDVITSASDPRVPMVQKVSEAVQAA